MKAISQSTTVAVLGWALIGVASASCRSANDSQTGAETSADSSTDSVDSSSDTHRSEAGGANPNGAACSSKGDCRSGFCADGLCCDVACLDQFCHSCALEGSLGTCSLVPADSDPRGECEPNDPASCSRNGQCDGRGMCQLYAAGQSCNASGGVCDGAGTCH